MAGPAGPRRNESEDRGGEFRGTQVLRTIFTTWRKSPISSGLKSLSDITSIDWREFASSTKLIQHPLQVFGEHLTSHSVRSLWDTQRTSTLTSYNGGDNTGSHGPRPYSLSPGHVSSWTRMGVSLRKSRNSDSGDASAEFQGS